MPLASFVQNTKVAPTTTPRKPPRFSNPLLVDDQPIVEELAKGTGGHPSRRVERWNERHRHDSIFWTKSEVQDEPATGAEVIEPPSGITRVSWTPLASVTSPSALPQSASLSSGPCLTAHPPEARSRFWRTRPRWPYGHQQGR